MEKENTESKEEEEDVGEDVSEPTGGQEDDEEQTYYVEWLGSCAIGIGTCLRLASRSASSDSARVTPEPEGEPEGEDVEGEQAPAADQPEPEMREEPGPPTQTQTSTKWGTRSYPFDVNSWRLERRTMNDVCLHTGWTDSGSNQYQKKWTCAYCNERWCQERPEWTRLKAEQAQHRRAHRRGFA